MSVIYLNKTKRFTYKEVTELLPSIKKISQESAIDLEPLLYQFETIKDKDLKRLLKEHIRSKADAWSTKMQGFGAVPKGLWLVDFDHGSGFYCWQLGENEVLHQHAYNEGFSKRVRIDIV